MVATSVPASRKRNLRMWIIWNYMNIPDNLTAEQRKVRVRKPRTCRETIKNRGEHRHKRQYWGISIKLQEDLNKNVLNMLKGNIFPEPWRCCPTASREIWRLSLSLSICDQHRILQGSCLAVCEAKQVLVRDYGERSVAHQCSRLCCQSNRPAAEERGMTNDWDCKHILVQVNSGKSWSKQM